MAMALAKRVSVGSRKLPQQIDLSQTYPCPCCHQGRLQGITLTEALGCDRCQYIFGLTPDHLHIENLAASYPYRKLWFWSGSHWVLDRETVDSASDTPVIRLLLFALMVVVVVFSLITQLIESVAVPPGLLIFIVVLGAGAGVVLLSYRR